MKKAKEILKQITAFLMMESMLLTMAPGVSVAFAEPLPVPEIQHGSARTTVTEKKDTPEPVVSRTEVNPTVEETSVQVLGKARVRVEPDTGGVIELGSVKMEIPAHAVDKPLEITLEELGSVAPLNAGLENTSPRVAGFRALPHGTQFKDYVKLTLPYDPSIVDTPAKLERLTAYFYDDQRKVWTKLDRIAVDEGNHVVTCLTSHFTDFITATLKLPDSPKPLGFNPTSIKDIKAADPSSEVPAPEGLEPSPSGSASFQMRLRLPAGRAGLAPQLALSYNSSGSSGWLGQGFDLSVPSISIDTSKRLPKFDGTDTYVWAGKRLVPVSGSEDETVFKAKIESDFATIVRKKVNDGAYNHTYTWEVREKNGKTTTFGGTNDSVNGKEKACDYQWFVSKIEDSNGNYCSYAYTGASNAHLYPESITYTHSADGGDKAYYRIQFVEDEKPRPDRRIDMRGGFQNKLDKRLAKIDIQYCETGAAQPTTIRSYVFTYQQSVFGKSQLASYKEVDGSGKQFYEYGFSYDSVTVTGGKVIGLKDPESWSGRGSESFSTSSSGSAGASLGASIFFPYEFPLGSVGGGVNISGGSSDTYENRGILDLNGDGIPDQIFHNMETDRQILLGNKDGSYTKATEDIPIEAWSWINSSMSSQTNTDIGLSAHASAASVLLWSQGYTTSTSDTSSGWSYMDLDGDGLVDLVKKSAGYFYKNTSTGNTVRFVRKDYNSSSVAPSSRNIPETVLQSSHLMDPLRMWIGYRTGHIDVDSRVKIGSVSSSWDGTTVKAYAVHGRKGAATLVGTTLNLTKDDKDKKDLSLGVPSMDVGKGDQLVFRQTSNVLSADDAISWTTNIHYTSINLFTNLTNRRYAYMLASFTTGLSDDGNSSLFSKYYNCKSDSETLPTMHIWTRKSGIQGNPQDILDYYMDRGYYLYEKISVASFSRLKATEEAKNEAAYNQDVNYSGGTHVWQNSYEYDPLDNVMVMIDDVKNNVTLRNELVENGQGTPDPVLGSMPVVSSSCYDRGGTLVSEQAKEIATTDDQSVPGYIDSTSEQFNTRVFVEKMTDINGGVTNVYMRPYIDESKKLCVEVQSTGKISTIVQNKWIDGVTDLQIVPALTDTTGVYDFVVTGDWKGTDYGRKFLLHYRPFLTIDRATGVSQMMGNLFKSTITQVQSQKVYDAQALYVADAEIRSLNSFIDAAATNSATEAAKWHALWLEALAGTKLLTPNAAAFLQVVRTSFTSGTGTYVMQNNSKRLLWLEILSGAVTIPGVSARFDAPDWYEVISGGVTSTVSIDMFYASNVSKTRNLSTAEYNTLENTLKAYTVEADPAQSVNPAGIADSKNPQNDHLYLDSTTNPATPVTYNLSEVYTANIALNPSIFVVPARNDAVYTAVVNAIKAQKANFARTVALKKQFDDDFNLADANGDRVVKGAIAQAEKEFVFWWELCGKVVVPACLEADAATDTFLVATKSEMKPEVLFYLSKYNLLEYTGLTERLHCDSEMSYTVHRISAPSAGTEYGFGTTVAAGSIVDAIVLPVFDGVQLVERPVYVHSFDTATDTNGTVMLDNIKDYGNVALPNDSPLLNYAGGGYDWFYAEWNGYPYGSGSEYSIDRITAQNKVFQPDTSEKDKEKIKNNLNDRNNGPRYRDCQVIWKMSWDNLFPGAWHGSVYTKQTTEWDSSSSSTIRSLTADAAQISGTGSRSYRLGGDDALLAIKSEVECGGNLSWIRGSTSQNTTTNTSDVTTTNEAHATGSSSADYEVMDVNGDRFPDLLKKSGSHLYAYLNKGKSPDIEDNFAVSSPSFETIPVELGSTEIRTFETNGVTHSGSIVAAASQAIRYMNAPGGYVKNVELDQSTTSTNKDASKGPQTSFSFSDGEGFTVGSSFKKIDLVDINGDGLPDRIMRSANDFSVSLNNGGGFGDSTTYKLSPSMLSNIGSSVTGHTSVVSGNNPLGDGKDSAISYSGNTSCSYNIGLSGGISDGLGSGLNGSFSAGMNGGLGISVSTDRTYYDLMDLNGDGLPDLLIKIGNSLYVCFNLGDSFGEPVEWGSNASAGCTLTNISYYNPMSGSTGSIDLGRFGGAMLLGPDSPLSIGEEISCSTSFNCSVNAGMNVGISFTVFAWALPLPWPLTGHVNCDIGINACIGGGTNITNVKYSYTDIDGDGLPDSVFGSSQGDMYVRRNQTGEDGLLKSVKLPQGGLIDLSYERTEATTDDPSGRYVLVEVVRKNWDDEAKPTAKPVASLPTNATRTRYEYSGGHYDRNDRSFWGYATVRSKRMTSLLDSSYATCTTTTYNVRDYYYKDLALSVETTDSAGNVLSRQNNAYTPVPFYKKTGYGIAGNWMCLDRTDSTTVQNGTLMTSSVVYESYDKNWGNPKIIAEYSGDAVRNRVYIDYYGAVTQGNHILATLPRALTVMDSNNVVLRKRTGSYDGLGNLIEQRSNWSANDSDCLVTTLEYIGNGNLKKIVDSAGYALTYEYDPFVGSFVTKVTDTLGQSSGWSYDLALGVELSQTDENGKTISKSYDTFGRMASVDSPYDTTAHALSFAYDTTSYPWKAITDNKVSYDSADGQTIKTVILCDGAGALLQTKKQAEVTAVPNGTSGSITKTSGWNVSPWTVVDSLGRERQKGTPTFDDSPDNLGLYEPAIRASFGGTDLYTENTYDARDRIVDVRLPDNTSHQKTEYELGAWQGVMAWKTTTTDPSGKKKCAWNDVNELTLAIMQDPDNLKILNTFSYDGIGQMLKALDDRGNATRIVYDVLGRHTSVDNPDTGVVTYIYDRNGDLAQKIDPILRAKNLAANYTYDQHRLMSEAYPDSTVNYEYGDDPTKNNVGRVIKTVNESVETDTSYGKLGEVTSIRRVIKSKQAGHADYDSTMSYGYNYLGQMTDITYPNGETVSYHYDEGGMVDSITGRFLNHDVSYAPRIGYDEYGQRVLLEQANGTLTTYTYDPARRWLKNLKTVRTSDNATIQFLEYEFNANGTAKLFKDTAGTKTYSQKYSYDALDQLESASGTFRDTSSVITRSADYTQQLAYDRIGNLQKKTSILSRSPAKSEDKELNYENAYTYSASKPHQASTIGDDHYVYDDNGNLIKIVPDWEWTGGTGPALDIVNVTQVTPGHDVGDTALGLNRVSKTSERALGTRYMTWDYRNRLTTVSQNGINTSYYYDTEGERRLKSEDGSETAYIDRMFEINTSSSNPVATLNVYLGDTRLVSKLAILTDPDFTTESRNTFYYHADSLGSSSLITDDKGEEYERMAFTPHGEVWQHDSLDTLERIDLLFTGKAMDAETGWYYFGARYLDPKTGMWLSCDPALGDYIPRAPLTKEDKEANGKLPGMGGVYNPVNLALYHYAGNNPVKYTDPDGRDDALVLQRGIEFAKANPALAIAIGAAIIDIAPWVLGGIVLSALIQGDTVPQHTNAAASENKQASTPSAGASIGSAAGSSAPDPNGDKNNPYKNKTKEQNLKSKDSYEKLIKEHEQKLQEFKDDPSAGDNKGLLEKASPEVKEKIIQGRIQALEKQIAKQLGELSKIKEALQGQ